MKDGFFLSVFGKSPRTKILEFFLDLRGLDYSIGDVARETKLNRATTYNMMEELIKEKIVIPTRRISGAQLYKLNNNNDKVKLLILAYNEGLKLINKEYKKTSFSSPIH
tara:strand:- start:1335 stop:1661 length:327 start_codon:yes stop_codon:yes gene_type:complete